MEQPTLDHNVSYLDLRLLLEHCQNIIQMNTIMLEQHKQLFSNQKDLISKNGNVSSNQIKCQSCLDSITEKINIYIQNMNGIDKSISAIYEKINNLITNKLDNLEDKIDVVQTDNTKHHGRLINKFYVALGGTATIIISLIGMITMIYDKHKIIENIEKIVIEISKHVK